MTNEDLYRAMTHTDPAYLEQSEQTVCPGRRALPKILIAAAAVAVLTCTAFAIPAVRNYILGLTSHQTYAAAVAETPGGREKAYVGVVDVTPEVDIPADAPETIETFYVPLYLAEHWEAVPREQNRETPAARSDTWLQWQSADGDVVSFWQTACPGYEGQYPYDTVPTGYEDDYEIGEVQYGGLNLWCITVRPSQAETAEGAETLEGFRKFYWSDGQYLFMLETPYDMGDGVLEQIFASVAPVEDLTPYERVEYVAAPEIVSPETQESAWLPSETPEGFALKLGTVVYGCYEFYWEKGDMDATLELLQRDGWDEGTIQQWETTTAEHTKEVVTIGDWEVTIYAREGKTEAMWQTETCNYLLTSRGREALSSADVIQVIESLEIVPDPEAWLTE